MRVSASRALNGSSSSSRSGSLTRARASDTRWAWPPDSDSGQASCFSVRPTSSRARRARSTRSAVAGEFSSARATFSPTLRQGSSRGSWNATDVRPDDGDLVGGGRVETGQAAQQGGLARAAAAEQGDELAGVHVEVEPRGARSVLPKERWCWWTRATTPSAYGGRGRRCGCLGAP